MINIIPEIQFYELKYLTCQVNLPDIITWHFFVYNFIKQ